MSPVIRHSDTMNPLYCVLKKVHHFVEFLAKRNLMSQIMRKYHINPSGEILCNCLVLIKCQGLRRQENCPRLEETKRTWVPDWVLEKKNLSGKMWNKLLLASTLVISRYRVMFFWRKFIVWKVFLLQNDLKLNGSDH